MSVYQIAIFADGADSYAATLRATIRRSLSDLGIPFSLLSFLNEASVSSRDRKSPTVGAYFGLAPHPAPARQFAAAHREDLSNRTNPEIPFWSAGSNAASAQLLRR